MLSGGGQWRASTSAPLRRRLPHPRLLVFDEDMPKRLPVEMKLRGRRATRVTELGLRGAGDPALIDALAVREPGCVLVTGNYWMPAEHEEAVRASTIAIATIDPRMPEGYDEPGWRRDVTHRWAHTMQRQRPGSVRRYAIAGTGRWTPNIRV